MSAPAPAGAASGSVGSPPAAPTPTTPAPAAAAASSNDDDRYPPKSYVVVNGLRYVVPYLTTQHYMVKDTMAGMTIEEVLATCFRLQKGAQEMAEARAYWRSVIEEGRVSVKRRKTAIDDIRPITQGFVQVDSDFITVKQDNVKIVKHQHERVVAGGVPEPLYDNGDWCVINKPPGIPCIASEEGKNNIVNITERLVARGAKLHLIHRIDAPVSGILLMCRKGATNRIAKEALAAREVHKKYLARVRGAFPEGETLCERALAWCSKGGHAQWGYEDDTAEPSPPPKKSPRHNNYKPAKTIFRRLRYIKETDESVVQASPVSGYRHQIRAHLAVLGYPIANDTLYHGWAAVPDGAPHKYWAVEGDADADAASTAAPIDGSPPLKKMKVTLAGGDGVAVPQVSASSSGAAAEDAEETPAPPAGDGRCCLQRRRPAAAPVDSSSNNMRAVYTDDASMTLRGVLDATRQPWCPKCTWVGSVLSGEHRLGLPELEGHIYLHALHYVIPALGLDVRSPVPEWAGPVVVDF